MARILLAEDEPRIASFISRGLEAHEFTVTVATDGIEALALARHGEFDLLILDIGLPSLDGFAVLERLRGSGSTLPVLILTARDSAADTVTGLEGGADDYMSKPFSFEELMVRVRLRLRQAHTTSGTIATTLTAGNVSLDLRTRQAHVDGRTVDLSAREFAMLEMFLSYPGQVLSREQLLSGVWGYDFDPGSNVVDVYVRYLRRKVGAGRIVTVRGMGYRFQPDAQP